jgi:hypothetical protein
MVGLGAGRFVELRPLTDIDQRAVNSLIVERRRNPASRRALDLEVGIVHRHRGELVGLVGIYDLDRANGHAKLTIMASPRFPARAYAVEGFVLFLSAMLRRFNLRKLYLEMTGMSAENENRQFVSYAAFEAMLPGSEVTGASPDCLMIYSIGLSELEKIEAAYSARVSGRAHP